MQRKKYNNIITLLIEYILIIECFILLFLLIMPNKTKAATLYATDENGITWAYTLDENDQAINVYYEKGTLPEEVTIPSTLDGYTVISIQNISGSNRNIFTKTNNGKNTTVTKVNFPETLRTIGDWAFYNCTGITGELIIPESVTSIKAHAFSGCSGFTGDLVIPNSVTDIGAVAFKDCIGLTGNLIISNNITSIGAYTFNGCSNLTGELIIPESVTSINAYAFNGCSGLTGDLIISENITNIGRDAFFNCKGITTLVVDENNSNYTSENDILYNKDKTTLIYCATGKVGEIQIAGTTTTILANAFYNCKNLTGGLTIPEGVTSIGGWAFYNCSGLTGDLVIPDSVTNINYATFYNCSGFDGILRLSNNLKNIPDYAFNTCKGLTGDLIIPKGATNICLRAFENCTGFTGKLSIPESVTVVETEAFKNCSGLTGDLSIPDSVTAIGGYAFAECRGFDGTLTISNNLTVIRNSVFAGCSSLTGELSIPEKVTTIGQFAFERCRGLTGDLIIPDNIISIGVHAFEYCSGFNGKLVLSKKLTIIESFAFNGCKRLEGELIIPNGVTKIGLRSFKDCINLTGNLIIPKGVTSIQEQAFENCSGLTGEVIIPDAVTSIRYNAFNGCSQLTDIFINNTKEFVLNLQEEGTWNSNWKGACLAIVHYSDCVHSINFGSDDKLDLEEVSSSKVGENYECESMYKFRINNTEEETELEKRIQVTKKVNSGNTTITEVIYADEKGLFTIERVIRDLNIKAEEKNKQVIVKSKDTSGKELSGEIVYGYLGDSYKIIQEEIEGYTAYGEIPENSVGTYTIKPITVELTYKPNTYTVSFETNGGNIISSKTVTYDDVYGELENPIKEGYTFVSWYLDEELTQKVDKDTQVTIAKNHTIYAKWEANKYTLTFETNGGNSLQNKSVTYNSAYGELEIPTKEGYTFGGWYLDEEQTKKIDKDTKVSTASNHTIYAKWEINEYSIKFIAEGTTVETITKKYGETIKISEFPEVPEKEGYTGKWEKEEDIVLGALNQEVKAIYTANEYTVNFDTNGGSAVENKIVTYNSTYGELDIPTKEGYTFRGWYLEDNGSREQIASTSKVKKAKDHTLYADWGTMQYSVSFMAEGITVKTISKDYGETIKISEFPEVPEKEGYTGKWEKEENIVLGALNQKIEAIYTANKYTLSFNTDGGSAVENKIVTYNSTYGELKIPTKEGYTFGGWYTESNSQGTLVTKETKVTKANNHKIYAGWTINEYEIILKVDGKEVGRINKKYQEEITEKDLPKPPEKEGYTGTWDLGETGSITVEEDKIEIKAKYTANECTVTFNSNGGTKVASKKVAYNSTYGNIAVPKKTGYVFTGWYKDKNLKQKITSTSKVTKAEKHTLYAGWKKGTYQISFNSNGGSKCNSKEVTYSETYGKLPTPEKTGYEFKGWYIDKGLTSKVIESTIVTKGTNHTLYAKWEKKAETVVKTQPEEETIKDKQEESILENNNVIKYMDENNNIIAEIVAGVEEEEKIKAPEKEGCEFIGWEKVINEETQEIIMKPIYREISHFEETSKKSILNIIVVIGNLGLALVLIIIVIVKNEKEVEINGKKYKTIEKGIKIIKESNKQGTIKLLRNIKRKKGIPGLKDEKITVDYNGYKIKITRKI